MEPQRPDPPLLVNPYKDHGVVAGERAAAGIGHVALLVANLAVVVAVAIVYGWLMSILARHIGEGVAGALEVCLLVLMGAIGVALIAGGTWAILQTRSVRRRLR
jgi:hypothetical protein